VWLRAGPEANDHAFADGRQDVVRESSIRLHLNAGLGPYVALHFSRKSSVLW
jgi:hypothetical protein